LARNVLLKVLLFCSRVPYVDGFYQTVLVVRDVPPERPELRRGRVGLRHGPSDIRQYLRHGGASDHAAAAGQHVTPLGVERYGRRPVEQGGYARRRLPCTAVFTSELDPVAFIASIVGPGRGQNHRPEPVVGHGQVVWNFLVSVFRHRLARRPRVSVPRIPLQPGEGLHRPTLDGRVQLAPVCGRFGEVHRDVGLQPAGGRRQDPRDPPERQLRTVVGGDRVPFVPVAARQQLQPARVARDVVRPEPFAVRVEVHLYASGRAVANGHRTDEPPVGQLHEVVILA